MRRLVVGLLLAAAIMGIAATATARVDKTTVVTVAFNKAIGKPIVVDGRGMTLYIFTLDKPGQATCTTGLPIVSCGKQWPGLFAPAHAGAGVAAAKLGTAKRNDGHTQVTYYRRALYFYAGMAGSPGDKKPGDVNGQGYSSYWYVIGANGKPIKTTPKG
jgi:predicted lipoprotein with Yx(FWY)xxD motif